MTAGMITQPESPRYLVQRGNIEAAAHSLGRLRGRPADHPAVRGVLAEIIADFEGKHQLSLLQQVKGSFVDSTTFYRVFIGVFVFLPVHRLLAKVISFSIDSDVLPAMDRHKLNQYLRASNLQLVRHYWNLVWSFCHGNLRSCESFLYRTWVDVRYGASWPEDVFDCRRFDSGFLNGMLGSLL